MLKKIIMLTVLNFVFIVTSPVIAEDYKKVPYSGVGVIGEYNELGDMDPENTPCYKFSFYRYFSWDCFLRSIVFDIGMQKKIRRILLSDNTIDNQGQANYLNENTIGIYFSNDNISYTKYTGNFNFTVSAGEGDIFDTIEISNLDIDARYIKLNYIRYSLSYDFITLNLASEDSEPLVSLYQFESDACDIVDVYLDNGFLVNGTNKIAVKTNIYSPANIELVCSLKKDDITITQTNFPIGESGNHLLNYNISNVEPGNYKLVISLAKNSIIRSIKELSVKTVKKLFTNKNDMNLMDKGDVTILAPEELTMGNEFWNLEDYAINTVQKNGKLLTSTSTSAPIIFQLPSKGLCTVYVGLTNHSGRVNIKLEGDTSFTTCLPLEDTRQDIDVITDVYFRNVDTQGQNIIIEPASAAERVSLAYLKLVRLTDNQSLLSTGVGDLSEGKKYIYTSDTYQIFDRDDITSMLENMALEPEIEACSWCIGPGVLFYPTTVGEYLADTTVTDFPRQRDEDVVEAFRAFDSTNNQSMFEFGIEEAHRLGFKFYGYRRMNHIYSDSSGFAELLNSQFWHDSHNENDDAIIEDIYSVRYPTGYNRATRAVPHLSYAYPEVRAYNLAILTELVQNYDVDGIILEFLRNAPFIGFEPIVSDSYYNQYGGVHPLDSGFKPDANWFRYQATYITQFITDLRAMLNAESLVQGKPFLLGVRLDCKKYLRQGLDIETWINNNLIDMIIAGHNGVGYPYAPPDDFLQMVSAAGSTIKVYGSTSPEGIGYSDLPPVNLSVPRVNLEDSKRRHLKYFKTGVSGMYLFNNPGDYPGQLTNLSKWEEFEDSLWFAKAPVLLNEIGGSNLVGWWRLDECADSSNIIEDFSGRNNHGRLRGAAAENIGVPGKIGKGVNLSETGDYLEVSSDNSLDFIDGMTFTAWVKPPVTDQNERYLVHKHNSYYVCLTRAWIASPYFSLYIDGAWRSVMGNALVPNSWNFVAATYDAATKTQSIYINGVKSSTVLSGLSAYAIANNNNDLYIGCNTFNSSYDIDGIMDDVRMYNRALSDTEIADIYQRGNLVGWWKLDEDVSCENFVEDFSDRKNHGELKNVATENIGVPGKIGKGVNLSETGDYLEVSSDNSLDFIDGMTFTAWVKPPVIDQNERYLVHKHNSYYVSLTRSWIASPYFSLYIDGAWRSVMGDALVPDIWNFVAVTYDAAIKTQSIYINGVKSSITLSGLSAYAIANNDNYLYIGCNAFNPGYDIDGIMDDVRMYNRALSDDEIADIYLNP